MTITGDNIKALRTERGLSLSELARLAGISKSYLHSIESGATKNTSAQILFDIAAKLDTTIEALMGVKHREAAGQSAESIKSLNEFVEELGLSDETAEMLSHIRYRGKSPENAKDWGYIFTAIKLITQQERT